MSIWQYKEILKQLEGQPLTLDEGNTPIDEVQTKGIKFLIKREDKNPSGSWKDRMTAFKISKLQNQKITRAVISTSGNAGISFLYYSKLYPELILDLVVSESINSKKLKKIQELAQGTKHQIHKTKFAKKVRSQLAAKKNSVVISSSYDDDSLIGYWSLGFEIAKLINKLNKKIPICVGASSGASVIGMVQGLSMHIKFENIFPYIVVCQTQNVHPLLPDLPINPVKSLADAITDKTMRRSYQVLKIINTTQGSAYSIENKELLQLKKDFYDLSYTSLLSIAGALRFREQIDFDVALCIASGL